MSAGAFVRKTDKVGLLVKIGWGASAKIPAELFTRRFLRRF